MLIIIALAVLVGLLTHNIIIGIATFVGVYVCLWLITMLFGIAIMGIAHKAQKQGRFR